MVLVVVAEMEVVVVVVAEMEVVVVVFHQHKNGASWKLNS